VHDVVQVVDAPQPGLKVADLPAATVRDLSHLWLIVVCITFTTCAQCFEPAESLSDHGGIE
jgi:hypothetical protein